MFYEYLDYPKLPSDLEAMCVDLERLDANTRWPKAKNLETLQCDHPPENFCRYRQFEVPKEVLSWLIKERIITRDIKIARIHAMYDGPKTYPHLDFPRTVATNYILTDSTATTCFYRHKFNPDIKPSHRNELVSPDEIELVDSVVLEHHRWHRLNVTTIHSVENITIPRIALTLSDK